MQILQILRKQKSTKTYNLQSLASPADHLSDLTIDSQRILINLDAARKCREIQTIFIVLQETGE